MERKGSQTRTAYFTDLVGFRYSLWALLYEWFRICRYLYVFKPSQGWVFRDLLMVLCTQNVTSIWIVLMDMESLSVWGISLTYLQIVKQKKRLKWIIARNINFFASLIWNRLRSKYVPRKVSWKRISNCGQISRLNSGIFRIFDPREWNLNLNSSDTFSHWRFWVIEILIADWRGVR